MLQRQTLTHEFGEVEADSVRPKILHFHRANLPSEPKGQGTGKGDP